MRYELATDIKILDLPDPIDVETKYPISATVAQKIDAHRQDVCSILDPNNNDNRLIWMTGPCSISDHDNAIELAEGLAYMQKQVGDVIKIIMRVYSQKPRSRTGWKGRIYQPDPNGPVDPIKGIYESRRTIVEIANIIGEIDEMLYPENKEYFMEGLTLAAVGARSVLNANHRENASGFPCPIAIKNTEDGSIKNAVDSAFAAQQPSGYRHLNAWRETSGNPFTPIMLRGGKSGPNYTPDKIAEAYRLLHGMGKEEIAIKNPAIFIDASHDNSLNGNGKDPRIQSIVLSSVLEAMRLGLKEYGIVRGIMFEMNKNAGTQPISADMDSGTSITDPCWPEVMDREEMNRTADLLRKLRH